MSELKSLTELAKDRAACEEIYKHLFPSFVDTLGDKFEKAKANLSIKCIDIRGGHCCARIFMDGRLGKTWDSPEPYINPFDLVSLFTKLGYEPKRL